MRTVESMFRRGVEVQILERHVVEGRRDVGSSIETAYVGGAQVRPCEQPP